MRVDRFGSLCLAPVLGALSGGREVRALPILMYHSVSDGSEVGRPAYYRLATSPVRFREQLQWLRTSGYSVLDLREGRRRLLDRRTDLGRSVVITFDDGFRDFLTNAWPVLEEFGCTASVFLPTRLIGDARRTFRGRECLTWPEVRELQSRGIVFGSHTASHPELYRLPWPDIRRELRESRSTIKSETGATADLFAYPFAFPQEDAAFVGRLAAELRDQGYIAAVTTAIGRAQSGSPLWLKRLPVNDADDPALLSAKLRGAYDWMHVPQMASRKLKMLTRRARTRWQPRHQIALERQRHD